MPAQSESAITRPFSGRPSWFTGASSGFGAEIAVRDGAEGARVGACKYRSSRRAPNSAARMQGPWAARAVIFQDDIMRWGTSGGRDEAASRPGPRARPWHVLIKHAGDVARSDVVARTSPRSPIGPRCCDVTSRSVLCPHESAPYVDQGHEHRQHGPRYRAGPARARSQYRHAASTESCGALDTFIFTAHASSDRGAGSTSSRPGVFIATPQPRPPGLESGRGTSSGRSRRWGRITGPAELAGTALFLATDCRHITGN